MKEDKKIKDLISQIRVAKFGLFLAIVSLIITIGIGVLVIIEREEIINLINFESFTSFEKLISVMLGWIIIRGK